MELSGSYLFAAPREQLWDALMDPQTVASCIPGVREFTPLGGDTYSFEVGVRVGPINAVYKGTIEAAALTRPESYRLIVSGSGAQTTVRGAGDITLTEESDGSTTLSFSGDLQVAGMLARVGQRLLTTAARAHINRFFECLQAKAAIS